MLMMLTVMFYRPCFKRKKINDLLSRSDFLVPGVVGSVVFFPHPCSGLPVTWNAS